MRILEPRIYLASQSPRRRELLKQIGVNFEVILLRQDHRRKIDIDETPLAEELPEVYVQRISREKAIVGWRSLGSRSMPPFPVLAADTTVTLDGKIFGKPENAEHASTMLLQFSGREHQVHSAVAIAMNDHVEVVVSTSKVRFAELDEDRIRRYLLSGEFIDKAGGYAIQGLAGAFIEHLSGSYSGVMGLPLFETVQLLRRFNCPTP
ncbi:MAG: nucleoside triphosphate pyrophosphatase [Gallionella sp.]